VFPGAIAAGTNGRKVTTAAITDGTINGTGTVTRPCTQKSSSYHSLEILLLNFLRYGGYPSLV
jgi:hypothetical protein